ncbi:P-loop containing nucleoside triphosphate hydrolase protein [Pisolithus croceorrhizus]|nr:P-loop containing nucleoside triphosphate hydrolase protein [Pisolithus croceorrhizus]
MGTFQRLLFGSRPQGGHRPPLGRRSTPVNDTAPPAVQFSARNSVQKSSEKAEGRTSSLGVHSQGNVSSSRSTIDKTQSIAKQPASRTLRGNSATDTNTECSPSPPPTSLGNFIPTPPTERSPHVLPKDLPKAYGTGAPSFGTPYDSRARGPGSELRPTFKPPAAPSPLRHKGVSHADYTTAHASTTAPPGGAISLPDTPDDALQGIELDDLTKEDIIIVIMGHTGAGKSSFVANATNSGDEGVGHGLFSHTSEIKATRCTIGGSNVVLVDTPGSDATEKPDLQILESISDWLNKSYEKGTLLSGILYFHRISDNRMAGTPLKNLRVFQKLCGKKAMSQVILVTTMWDEVEESVGNERLEELVGNYWKVMIAQGSTTYRYGNTPESSRQLLSQLVKRKRCEVRLQKQMADKTMELRETDAGRELSSPLDQIAEKRAEITARRHQAGEQAAADNLGKQYSAPKAKLDEALPQVQAPKSTSVKRAAPFIRKAFR